MSKKIENSLSLMDSKLDLHWPGILIQTEVVKDF